MFMSSYSALGVVGSWVGFIVVYFTWIYLFFFFGMYTREFDEDSTTQFTAFLFYVEVDVRCSVLSDTSLVHKLL